MSKEITTIEIAGSGTFQVPAALTRNAYDFRAEERPMILRADDEGQSEGWEMGTGSNYQGGLGNYFEAIRDGGERTGIPYAMVNLAPQVLRLLNGLNRKILSAVARYLVDNNGMAKLATSQIAHHATPVHCHAACADTKIAAIYDAYWQQWLETADMTKRFTFEELQTIACKAVDIDGDIGYVMTAKYGFPQVRFFDTYHIGNLAGMDPQDGVVVDDLGVLLGFKVCDGPIDTLVSAAQTFIPESQMNIAFDAERYNFYRGFSAMRAGSNNLRDLWDILNFTKTKEKVGAALAAVIQQKGPLDEDEWGDRTGPGNYFRDEGGRPGLGSPKHDPKNPKITLAQLFGGDIPVIDGELKQFITQASGVQTMDFIDYLGGLFVAGLDVPPAWFLDAKMTGPNQRSVMGKVQKKLTNRCKTICKFVKFCRTRAIAWGIAHDGLPETPDWQRVWFQHPPLISIDLGDQMQNERADVLCGQMSEKRRFGNQGHDWQQEQRQILTEIDAKLGDAVTLYKKYQAQGVDLPIEIILARMGFGSITLSENKNQTGAAEENQEEASATNKEKK